VAGHTAAARYAIRLVNRRSGLPLSENLLIKSSLKEVLIAPLDQVSDRFSKIPPHHLRALCRPAMFSLNFGAGLTRHNEGIFGTLFAVGELFVFWAVVDVAVSGGRPTDDRN